MPGEVPAMWRFVRLELNNPSRSGICTPVGVGFWLGLPGWADILTLGGTPSRFSGRVCDHALGQAECIHPGQRYKAEGGRARNPGRSNDKAITGFTERDELCKDCRRCDPV